MTHGLSNAYGLKGLDQHTFQGSGYGPTKVEQSEQIVESTCNRWGAPFDLIGRWQPRTFNRAIGEEECNEHRVSLVAKRDGPVVSGAATRIIGRIWQI